MIFNKDQPNPYLIQNIMNPLIESDCPDCNFLEDATMVTPVTPQSIKLQNPD